MKAIAADDLSACKPVARRLGVDRQTCLAHVKKRVWNRLDRIEGWDWVKTEIWRLPTELPLDGGSQLLRLERAVRDKNEELRRPRIALSDKRRTLSLLCRRRRRGVQCTNNMTERAIGGS